MINVYAPNDYREEEQFIRISGEKLVSKTDTTKLIISGDWNAIRNKIDKWGELPWKETIYRNSIIGLMEELDLLDIYRQFHVDTKPFTYETKNSKLKSRIDFFLVSRPISHNVKRTEVRSSIAPDHKAIFLGMELQSELKRGPGTWKFNNTLLEDQDYIDLINIIYPRTQEKYKDVESKQLLWELVKMELRAKTISYSKKKRAEVKKRGIILQHNLDELDYKICNDADLDPHILDQYEAEQNELNYLYELKGKQAIFRPKVKWIEQGEKPTKYFLI